MYKTGLITILLAFLSAAPAHAAWTPAVRISDEVTAYSPRIVANGDTLHVVCWTWSNTARSFYLRSTDGGTLWEAPFRLGDSLIQGSDSSPLIAYQRDTIITIWHQNMPGGGQYNYGFRRSTNGGEIWDDVIYILPSNSYELQNHALTIGGGGYLVYSRWAQEIIVEFTKSMDWGQTWTEPTEVFRTEQTGRFDMAARGNTIHVVWVGRFDYEHRWEIYHIRSTDSGESWSENILLSTADDRGSNWPTISINSAGRIAVCWMDYKYSPYFITGDIFIRYSYDGGDSWTEEEQLTSHHLVFPVRVLWRGDSIHVVWEDWRNEQPDIYYKYSKDNGLTWEDEQRVEDDPGSSEDPDLEIVGDNIHLVWPDFGQTSGSGIYYTRWEEEVAVEEIEGDILPKSPSMEVFPNPLNSNVILSFKKEKGGEAQIEIFDIRGRLVKSLCKGGNLEKGTHNFTWDATDALGKAVSSGLYFAVASTPQGKITKILTLIR